MVTAVPWLQLRFTVDRANAEALSSALEVLGAQAVTMQSADSETLFDQIDESPTLWDLTRLTALFEANVEPASVIDALARQLAPQSVPPCSADILADRDWNRVWMDRFHPTRFGQRLWVVPSWRTAPQPDAVNLILDPGMAFGTGAHATTALCLGWLDSAPIRGKVVLDYGCGSGILAIAAVKLGARHAYAVDIDPKCLEVARENAKLNRVADKLSISLPGKWPVQKVDVLLANILAGPLLALVEPFADYLCRGGDLVLSGLLAYQADECVAAYRPYFDMDAPLVERDWAMLHGTRR
jgi:ribosomal protein L11 methyltransferase